MSSSPGSTHLAPSESESHSWRWGQSTVKYRVLVKMFISWKARLLWSYFRIFTNICEKWEAALCTTGSGSALPKPMRSWAALWTGRRAEILHLWRLGGKIRQSPNGDAISISVPLSPGCPQRERGSRPQRARAGARGGGGGRSPRGGHFRPRAQSRSAGRAAATPTRKGAGPRAGSGRLHNGGGGAHACVTRRLPAAPAAPYITGVRAARRPQWAAPASGAGSYPIVRHPLKVTGIASPTATIAMPGYSSDRDRGWVRGHGRRQPPPASGLWACPWGSRGCFSDV